MCVRVFFDPPDSVPTFDADARVIKIPAQLPPTHSMMLVRAILHELVVPQPEFGAVCWCGDQVDLVPLIPHQKTSEQVVKHGA